MLKKLDGSTVLFVKSIDRPGPNYTDLNERTNIRQRQTEGIAVAKAKGVKFGRPPKPLPDNFYEVYQRWKTGKISVYQAARECGMPESTFRDRAKKINSVSFSYMADTTEKYTFLSCCLNFTTKNHHTPKITKSQYFLQKQNMKTG